MFRLALKQGTAVMSGYFDCVGDIITGEDISTLTHLTITENTVKEKNILYKCIYIVIT